MNQDQSDLCRFCLSSLCLFSCISCISSVENLYLSLVFVVTSLYSLISPLTTPPLFSRRRCMSVAVSLSLIDLGANLHGRLSTNLGGCGLRWRHDRPRRGQGDFGPLRNVLLPFSPGMAQTGFDPARPPARSPSMATSNRLLPLASRDRRGRPCPGVDGRRRSSACDTIPWRMLRGAAASSAAPLTRSRLRGKQVPIRVEIRRLAGCRQQTAVVHLNPAFVAGRGRRPLAMAMPFLDHLSGRPGTYTLSILRSGVLWPQPPSAPRGVPVVVRRSVVSRSWKGTTADGRTSSVHYRRRGPRRPRHWADAGADAEETTVVRVPFAFGQSPCRRSSSRWCCGYRAAASSVDVSVAADAV